MPRQLTSMKLQIIKVVFLVIFFVFLATGIFSFTHQTELLESISLLLAAATSLLTFIALNYNSSKNPSSKKISRRTISIYYLITFILFTGTALSSVVLTENMLVTTNLIICAFAQIISYRVFIKQNSNTL